jgi:hypothetical protein
MPEDIGSIGSAAAVAEVAPAEIEETPTSVPAGDAAPPAGPPKPTEPPEPAEPTEPVEPEPGPEEEESGLGDVEESPDAQVGKQISDLKKSNPAAAKAWAKDHYSLNAYKQEFPSVQEARSAKATLESLGGEEGINDLTSEVGDYRNEIEQFSNGDPELLNQLYEANPDALATAGQNLLQLFGERNTGLYDKIIAPAMSTRLADADVYSEFDRLLNFVKEGDGQSAWDTGLKIRNWFEKLQRFAQSNGREARQKVNPEAEALAREREEVAQERSVMRETAIRNDVNTMNMSATKKVVDPFFREVKLTNDGKKSFVDQLNSRIYAMMKGDKTFQRNFKNIRDKGDNARAARFVAGKFAELLPGQFRKLRDALYPNYQRGGTKVVRPNGAAAAGTPAAPKGPVPVPAHGKITGKSGKSYRTDSNGWLIDKPDDIDVDRSKTDMVQWIAGKGVMLTNGQRVNLNWREIRR